MIAQASVRFGERRGDDGRRLLPPRTFELSRIFFLDPPPDFLYKLTGRSDKNEEADEESQGKLAKAGVKFLNETEANGSETVCSGV
jgi:hypothetical protein